MNQGDLDRLRKIDVRVREIAEDMGLLTTEIMFEIVSAQRVLEGMSYNFPTNFSHWSFDNSTPAVTTKGTEQFMSIPVTASLMSRSGILKPPKRF